jgi:uncharacterized OB-fold protein/acyl dehydratase
VSDVAADLKALVGQPAGPPDLSPHPVNAPMIQHWVEAMGDHNPAYVDDEAARAAGLPGAYAPPQMLQAWIMRGLRATQRLEAARAAGTAGSSGSAMEKVTGLLDGDGMTSVVATNCTQQYGRPLVIGDRLVTQAFLEDVSDVKETALGTGRFVTTRTDFHAVREDSLQPGETAAEVMARGEPVATMRFRILKFRPKAKAPAAEPRPKRPRPAITQDNAFFFEGAREGKLLIQRCTACGTLRHPPLPACGNCRSFEWDTVAASGRGELYSWVVVHYPQVPAFDYPLLIGLVELAEGTRLVADLLDVTPEQLRLGLPLEAAFVECDDELTLPMFRPAGGGA